MTNEPETIWLLTEERPKNHIVAKILNIYLEDCGCDEIVEVTAIKPLFINGKFTFIYQALISKSTLFSNVFIKIVSGESSFVDYLLFVSENEPSITDKPLYGIEVTKTSDSESRNTGVSQRMSKFVYIDFYYPNIKKIMMYDLHIPEKDKVSGTNNLGNRILTTLGVKITGKNLSNKDYPKIDSISELISLKNSMRNPPDSNVPIRIYENDSQITITGRLYKSGGLSHDPNIGTLTALSKVIRILGYKKRIVISKHGLQQIHIGRSNKFIRIAAKLHIELDGLNMPTAIENKSNYWHYDTSQEKLASILLTIIAENYSDWKPIYENHGGCERGYFYCLDGTPLAIEKYKTGEKELYKSGRIDSRISIPDLILCNKSTREILDLEGKIYANRKNGEIELNNYDYLERNIIQISYKDFRIKRAVVLYGGNLETPLEDYVIFELTTNGDVLYDKSSFVKEAVEKTIS